jgi:peptidyl-prolyl cis-trans isomerase C
MKSLISSRAAALAIVLLASVPMALGDTPPAPSSPASAAEPAESTVVGIVTIDGAVVKKVTAGDVKSKLSVLPPQLANAPYEQIFPLLLKSVVTEQIIMYYAEKAGIKNKPDYAKMVEECKKGAEQKLFLEGKIEERATDEELKKSYEEVKKAAPKEDEYNISMITLTDKKQAKDVFKKVNVSNFAEVANKESMNKIPDGNLGYVRLGELPEAFREKVKSAAKATIVQSVIEISMPDPSQAGKKVTTYNIVMVQDKRPATFPPFEAVKGELKTHLSSKLAKEVIKDLESKAKVELFGLDGKPIDQKADATESAPKTDAAKGDALKADAAKAAAGS